MRFTRIDEQIEYAVHRGFVYIRCARTDDRPVVLSINKGISRHLIQLMESAEQEFAVFCIKEYAYNLMRALSLTGWASVYTLYRGKEGNKIRKIVAGGLNAIHNMCQLEHRKNLEEEQTAIDESVQRLFEGYDEQEE